MINCNVAGVEEGNVKNVTAWRGYISSTPVSLKRSQFHTYTCVALDVIARCRSRV